MLLFEALDQILARLEEHRVESALLGGLAISVWAEPRFTRDVDLAVAVRTDREAEDLVHNLSRQGYTLLATVEQTAAGRLATARLSPPSESDEGMVVDLLFASSGIETEIVDAAVELDIGASTPVRVARVGHLVVLKLLAHDPGTRPQDALDLYALRAISTRMRRSAHTMPASSSCNAAMAAGATCQLSCGPIYQSSSRELGGRRCSFYRRASPVPRRWPGAPSCASTCSRYRPGQRLRSDRSGVALQSFVLLVDAVEEIVRA